MKTALFTLTALALAGVVLLGNLHPVHVRAILGLAVVVVAFLALLPYHKEGNK